MRRLPGTPPPACSSPATALCAPLTRAEIALAVPSGSRRARSQPEWLRRVQQEVAASGLRGDRAQNVLWWAEIHARHASWEDRTTRPTRALTCQLARFSVSTYQRCRRWLEEHELIGLVRPGLTPFLRPMALTSPDDTNQAAVYVLAIPRKPPPGQSLPGERVTDALTASRSDPVLPRARETPFLVRLVAKATGQSISDGWGAWIERPFRQAGWTDRDLRHAIDWPPRGRQHPYLTKGVRHPVRWLMWRLRWHLQPDDALAVSRGELRWRDARAQPSKSQRQASAAAERHAQRVAEQARNAEAAAAARPPSQEYLAMREALFPGLPSPAGRPLKEGRKT